MLTPAYLAIRTCNRPGYLQRQLLSISRRSPDAGTLRVLVFDDSRAKALQQRNRSIVASAVHRFGIQAEYLGAEWQRGFSAGLQAALPQHAQSIQWLLDERPEGVFTAGRLLNLIILSLAGHRFALFDDDYRLDQARHLGPGLSRKLQWSRDPARQVLGFDSVRAAREAGMKLGIDPIDEHFKYLGRRLEDCLQPPASSTAPLLDSSEAGEPPAKLQLDADSRILTTVNGQYGVPIAPNSFYLFHQSHGAAGPVWADPDHYRVLRQGRAVWNVTYEPVIAGRTGSTPSSVDNRELMPPTLPLCRGEDTLFCALVKFAYPNAAHLFLPWALEHSRKPRSLLRATFAEPQKITLAKIFWKEAEALAEEVGSSLSATQRLEHMAEYWQGWAELPHHDRREEVIESWRRGLKWRIRITRECLDHLDGAPGGDHSQARRDLGRALRQFEQDQEMQDGMPPLEDAPGIEGEQQRIDWLAGVARDFSRALQAWPELWNLARQMQPLG